jgi:hypothetical protein
MALPSLRTKRATPKDMPKRPAAAAATATKPTLPPNQVGAAAAMNLEGIGWKDFKFGSSAWQLETMRHYDRCPELRAVANAIASMASRCELFITKKENGEPGKKVEDAKIGELSDQIFGGSEERPELIRLAALNLYAPGEYFQYVETVAGETADRWMVLSVAQVKQAPGESALEFERPHKYGGGKVRYFIPQGKDKTLDAARAKQNTGLLGRCWTPHPQKPDHADSSVRSALSLLNLIEQYDKRSSAQNDSRLAGAGILFLPDSLDFPRGDDEQNFTPGEALEARIADVAGRTLKDQGNARSLVPITATVKGDEIDKIKWLTFETPLDQETKDRLDQCIRRLALGLDVPPEILLGLGGMNHWGAWQAEASTHTDFVAPLLARICHCLTETWLQPILTAMGVDPNDYMVWFDMSPLVVHANRLADAIQLWELGILNDDAVLEAANFPKTAAHTPESFAKWLFTKAVLQNPQLLSDANVTRALGITVTTNPADTARLADRFVSGEPAGAPPIEQGVGKGQQAVGAAPAGGPPQEPPTTAGQLALVAAVEMAALHSLGIANKKMLTRGVRDDLMTTFAGRPFDLHTRLQVNGPDHALQLLDGTFDLLPSLGQRTGTDPQILQDILRFYCSGQMVAGSAHDPGTLAFLLSEGVLAAGHRRCTLERCVNQQHPHPCRVPVPA